MEYDINVPEQIKTGIEPDNGIAEIIDKFVQDIIAVIRKICDNHPKIQELIEMTSYSEHGKVIGIDYKQFAKSDTEIIEIVCFNRLLACIYSRRTEFNYLETTFFLYEKTFEIIEQRWQKMQS